ncbi:MAG: hypothetical protein EXS24_02130 [Pedosphaera sp.]|nr:hypothetical protein [Pedosphaera sp.]
MTISGNNSATDLNRLTADVRQSQVSARQQPARVDRPEVSQVSERSSALQQARSVDSSAASALSELAVKARQVAAGLDNSTPGLKEFAIGLSTVFTEDASNPSSAMGRLSELRNSYGYVAEANDRLSNSPHLSLLE